MIKVRVLYSVGGVATQILLSRKREDLLVDAGDGVLRDLVARQYDFSRLKGILLTHEDFDHISGLYALVSMMRNYHDKRPRQEPLSIFAPKPIHHVQTLLEPPLMYRAPPFLVELKEITESRLFSIGPFKVKPFEVVHKPERGKQFGYSISDPSGFKVVVSGDTRPCEALRREARDADIAIIEATLEDKYQNVAPESGHMTRGEAKSVGRLAKRTIYVHRLPRYLLS